MENEIVKMERTNLQHARQDNVMQDHSNVKMVTARHQQQYVTVRMIVVMHQTSKIAINHVQNLNLNVVRMEDVY